MAKHRFVIEGQAFEVEVHARFGDHSEVSVNGKRYRVEHAALEPKSAGAASAATRASHAPAQSRARVPSGVGEVRAPMAGKVLSVAVSAGDATSRGQSLLVLDAMKMENTLAAPFEGIVEEVAVGPGATVLQGALLVRLRNA